MRILTYSLPAGRIMGIPLRVHWMLLLFIPAIVSPFVRIGTAAGGGTFWLLLLMGAVFVAVLYGSVLLHELGHCWGNRLVGNSAREIQLTPLGGIAIGEGANHSPRTELLVVGLGPAVSLALALLGWGGNWAAERLWPHLPVVTLPLEMLFRINLMLFLFNALLPIFPLDAAKLLRAGLSLRMNPQKATLYMAHAGIGLAVILLLASFSGIRLPFLGTIGPLLMLILILGIQACVYEMRVAEHDQVYSTWDTWGARPVYYDADIMSQARRRAESDLRVRRARPEPSPFERVRRAAEKGRKTAGPAKVLLATPKPEELTDPAEVRELMLEAANAQDFVLAARLKRRLQELTGEQ